MKRAVIIDTYPSSDKEISILKKCVDTYKDKLDIVIVTHLPVTIEGADYVIYDKNNTFLPPHLTPYFWLRNESFDVEIYNAGHTLPICRNMSNGIHLCQSLGYDEFIFTEADVILTDNDQKKLFALMDEHKKMLFFKPEHFRDCDSYVYETLLFGGNTNYFLEKFKPPTNLEQWVQIPMGHTLELSFYERFSSDEEEFSIINQHSSEYFAESEVNLLRYGLLNCVLLKNTESPIPVLFIMNSLVSGERVFGKINNMDFIFHKSQFWMNQLKDDTIVELFDEKGNMLLKKYFTKETNTQGIIRYK